MSHRFTDYIIYGEMGNLMIRLFLRFVGEKRKEKKKKRYRS
jgi:hypothetical protein